MYYGEKTGEISDSSDQSLDRDRFLSGELCGHTSSAGILYEAAWISEAVKGVAAVYMLLNTFGETDCRYGKIVLVGTTVYACSLVADRIGYLYEPIFGGGFPETGGLVLTAAFGCVLWRDLSEAIRSV